MQYEIHAKLPNEKEYRKIPRIDLIGMLLLANLWPNFDDGEEVFKSLKTCNKYKEAKFKLLKNLI